MAEPRTLFHGGWVFDAASASLTAADIVVADGRVLERYPHATLAVIEDAGHALMHEQPELLAALVSDRLDRARPEVTESSAPHQGRGPI